MKDYYQLTLRGKARRLRQMAIKALEDYDLDVTKVSLITNGQNGIFRVDTQDKQKYILRVTLPDAGHTVDEIKSEMKFLNAIQHEPSINAPIPLKTKTDDWMTTVEIEGVPQPRHCVVFSWVPGVDIAHRRSPLTWEKLGTLSAQLHQLGNRFTTPEDFHILTYNSVFPFREDCVLFDEKNRQYFNNDESNLLKYALDLVQAEIDRMYREDTAGLRVTHGDLHQWNVRIARGSLSPIDFEDLMWAYPLQDISTTLYYNRLDDNYDALLAAFKRGYESILPFPEEFPGQLEIHMLSRRIGLLNYIFTAEELDVVEFHEFADFIPNTIQRIQWIQENVWDK